MTVVTKKIVTIFFVTDFVVHLHSIKTGNLMANPFKFGSVVAQPTSTIYSGLKRLLTQGFLLKNDTYEMDDPFFAQWIVGRRNNA